jgi:L-amino acid N-acyltransferase YncA
MRIRRVRRPDIPQIARLYYDTVHRVNARDYSPEQIRGWAPRVYPDAFWQRRFRRYEVVVAEDSGAIVGFVELEKSTASTSTTALSIVASEPPSWPGSNARPAVAAIPAYLRT